jgi:hypothetical protein
VPDSEDFFHADSTKIDNVRRCPAPDCDKPLQRRVGESPAHYDARMYCDRKCFGRGQRSAEQHGSITGLNWHRRTGTPLCDACRDVQRTYASGYRADNPDSVARERARYRAMKALTKLHRAEYLRLCFEEYQKAGVA